VRPLDVLAVLTENAILRFLSDKAQLANDEKTAESAMIFDKMVNETGSGDSVHSQ
jgi:hypothetical protein